MTASETLRAALDGPQLTFEVAEPGATALDLLDTPVHVNDSWYVTLIASEPEAAAFRTVRLLQAAAPHLADLLDALAPCIGAHDDKTRDAWMNLHAAIREAGETR